MTGDKSFLGYDVVLCNDGVPRIFKVPLYDDWMAFKSAHELVGKVPVAIRSDVPRIATYEPYYKVVITNHIVEIFEMEKTPYNRYKDLDALDRPDGFSAHLLDKKLLGRAGGSALAEGLADLKVDSLRRKDEQVCRKQERRNQTLRDSRNKCRRLAIANFNSESLFITLTVAENSADVEYFDNEFKKFLKRFRYAYGNFDYIAVREFQKRGAIHYHILCNSLLEWKSKKELESLEREFGTDIWGHGFVDIQRMNKTKKKGQNVDNVGAYLIKYMSKEYDDVRLKGKKAYLCSRGLEQPIVMTGNNEEILKFVKEFRQKKETFANQYASEYQGQITYNEYNLLR